MRDGQAEDFKTRVKGDGQLDIYVVFPEDFDAIISQVGQEGYVAPNVEIYYSSSNENSLTAYSAFSEVLDLYERMVANVFNVNAGNGYDLGTPQSSATYILSAIVPMVLLVLLFSGCMAVAPESIAGEKERGARLQLCSSPQ